MMDAEGQSLEILEVKRRRGKTLVSVEGQEPQIVPDIVLMRHYLREGETVNEATWQTICGESREELCSDQALRLLGQRPHGTRELELKLRTRKHDRVAIRAAIDRLESAGLLDDEAFATIFAEEKLQFSGWGRRRIESALCKKGVRSSLVREVVAAVCDADESEEGDGLELTSAIQVAERKLRSLQREPDVWARRRKLMGFLARRGFSSDVCRRVLERVEV